MRNTRAVYQKLREVKYFHLIQLYKRYLKKIPENCTYNCSYKFSSNGGVENEIRLCLLHQPHTDLKVGVFPHLIDLCQETKDCVNCNAFILRHTKESVHKIFELELSNQKVKQKKYPDICALEWVMEKSMIEFKSLFILKKIYMWIKNKISKESVNEQ
jgi:hypothetical protein